MKRTIRQIMAFLALALILGSSNAAFAQTVRRIGFAKGSNVLTLKGTGYQAYILRVGADQTVKIRLVSKGNRATFDFLDANGSDLSEGTDGRDLEMTVATAGDYVIETVAPKGTVFTLTVSIK